MTSAEWNRQDLPNGRFRPIAVISSAGHDRDMSMLLFFAAQAVPVPPGPVRPANHTFTCTIFTADGERQRITGKAKARGKWGAELALSSPDAGGLPLGTFRASAQGPASLAVKAKANDGEEYTYVFERTNSMDTGHANGRVVVSKQKWPAAFHYVATGICDFASEVAR